MKRHVKDFAVLGGSLEFQTPLIVGRPGVLRRDSFLKRVEAILDSGHLTNGGPMARPILPAPLPSKRLTA